MPIFIKKKMKSIAGASNKEETLAKSTATDNHAQAEQNGCPTPFIDKISLIIDLPTDTIAHSVYNAVISNLDAKDLFAGANKTKGYQVTKRVLLPSIVDFKKLPLFQCAYDSHAKVALRLRLEFVPVDLGQQGMEELHVQITSVLNTGWKYVVEHARVTRLDIAVDLPNTAMDNFVFLPQQAATVTVWKSNGAVESIYTGKPNGNQTKIYSRSKKRLAKKQSWDGSPQVRVERKLINLQGLKLTDLHTLPNPFVPIALVDNLPGPPPAMDKKKHWQWSLFRDSVEVRGLTAALALLPPAQRTQFRKHLIAHPKSYWNPEKIWKSWKPMLDELNIDQIHW